VRTFPSEYATSLTKALTYTNKPQFGRYGNFEPHTCRRLKPTLYQKGYMQRCWFSPTTASLSGESDKGI